MLAGRRDAAAEDTSVPLELDQIYASLDDLTVALGPNGANSNGALTDLLETTAENFGGQGEKFHQTIKDFGQLSADPRRQQGGAVRLRRRSSRTSSAPWPQNDTTVRRFNHSLVRRLDDARRRAEELAASLQNLAIALGEVTTFVKDNNASLARNIKGLNRVAKVLVKQRDALDEILDAGPLALNNLALTYNPQAGTLDTNANLGELVDQIESDPGAVPVRLRRARSTRPASSAT